MFSSTSVVIGRVTQFNQGVFLFVFRFLSGGSCRVCRTVGFLSNRKRGLENVHALFVYIDVGDIVPRRKHVPKETNKTDNRHRHAIHRVTDHFFPSLFSPVDFGYYIVIDPHRLPRPHFFLVILWMHQTINWRLTDVDSNCFEGDRPPVERDWW